MFSGLFFFFFFCLFFFLMIFVGISSLVLLEKAGHLFFFFFFCFFFLFSFLIHDLQSVGRGGNHGTVTVGAGIVKDREKKKR